MLLLALRREGGGPDAGGEGEMRGTKHTIDLALSQKKDLEVVFP